MALEESKDMGPPGDLAYVHCSICVPRDASLMNAVIDMSDGYRSLIREHFPNAQIIADKFHVLRLLTPALNKHRVALMGDDRKNPIRRLLLRNRPKLVYYERDALDLWLKDKSELRELYYAKEALHNFYRTRGIRRASRALTRLTDLLAQSKLKELKRFRRTLVLAQGNFSLLRKPAHQRQNRRL
jgi:transposase